MEPSLYDAVGRRKHLGPAERERFLKAAVAVRGKTATFCAVLLFTGARISEDLNLTPNSIEEENDAINFLTLKQRLLGVTRSIPVPHNLILQLYAVHRTRKAKADPQKAQQRLWTWSRTTAWRRVKKVMEMARIPPYLAHPHTLRHTFATEADDCGIEVHIIQGLLGHTSIRTTRRYLGALTRRIRELTSRTWHRLDELLRLSLRR